MLNFSSHCSPSRLNAALPALACRTLAGALGMSPMRNKLSILIYHRVLAKPDPLFPGEIDAERFERHLRMLKRCFNMIALSDAVDGLRHGRLPSRAACLTFDDGYADNAEVALPILQRHGVGATFFVASGFLNGGRMWNDSVIELIRHAPQQVDLSTLGLGRFVLDSIAARRQAIGTLLGALKYLPIKQRQQQVDAIGALIGAAPPDNLMMTDAQVRQLHRAGMTIGGHTVNHPIIARMEAAAAYTEITEGKAHLEQIIGAPLRLFAYPNGKPGQDYHAEHVEMVKSAGFDAAVSTAWGAAARGSDLFQLPRFTPWDQGQVRFTLRMLHNLTKSGQLA